MYEIGIDWQNSELNKMLGSSIFYFIRASSEIFLQKLLRVEWDTQRQAKIAVVVTCFR